MSQEVKEYKFEYRHFRPRIFEMPVLKDYKCKRYMRGVTQWKPLERGGATLCLVFNDGDEILAWGLAFCCMRDNFSYQLGRQIAKGRALAALKGTEPKKFNGYNLSGTEGDLILFKSLKAFFIPAQ